MKIYYYAFSGHKWGLDRVKRGVALINLLKDQGVQVQLFLNDFRAGLVAKEFGVGDAVTLETIMDVDVIAQKGDVVFIDTPEEDRGRIERYTKEYSTLFHVLDSCDTVSSHGEVVMSPSDENFSSLIVDKDYFDILEKVDRRVFFFGDSDYDKAILAQSEFFSKSNMELILGNYFFVKYEDALAKIFITLHEPEEYKDLIRTSSEVVTASSQTALEARASGAKVVYCKQKDDSLCLLDKLDSFGINIIDSFDNINLESILKKEIPENKKVINYGDITMINIMNRINL